MYAAVFHGISQFSEIPFIHFLKIFYYLCIFLLCVLLGSGGIFSCACELLVVAYGI